MCKCKHDVEWNGPIKKRGNKDWGWVMLIASLSLMGVFFATLFALTRFREHFPDPLGGKIDTWGQVGDFFGGILNPIIGVATIIMIFLGLIVQRRELKESADALEKANEHSRLQAIEQSLFAWLSSYQELLGQIEAVHSPSLIFKGKGALRDWYENSLKMPLNYPMAGLSSEQVLDFYEMEHHRVRAALISQVNLFDKIFENNRHYLDAPLQTLVAIITWIDNYPKLTPEQKNQYIAVIKTQLSWIELVFLFYYGFQPGGRKFPELSNKYYLLENLAGTNDSVFKYVVAGNVTSYLGEDFRTEIPIPYSAESFAQKSKNPPSRS